MANRRGPLGDRPIHRHHVDDLVAFLVLALHVALAGERDHRRAVHVGVRHARDQIGCTRTKRAQAHGRITGQPAIDVGHERGRLLVPREDEADVFRFVERQQEFGIFFARHAEHVLDLLLFEAADE